MTIKPVGIVLRIAVILLLSLALGACLTEIDPIDCFQDGTTGFRVDPETGAAIGSDQCCRPDDDGKSALCSDFYTLELGVLDVVAKTARCDDSISEHGVCTTSCDVGINCECQSIRDCTGGTVCAALTADQCAQHIAASPGVLADPAPSQCFVCVPPCPAEAPDCSGGYVCDPIDRVCTPPNPS